MTEAWQVGIPLGKAAVAFRCNVRTMLPHHVAVDETATADELLTAFAPVVRPKLP